MVWCSDFYAIVQCDPLVFGGWIADLYFTLFTTHTTPIEIIQQGLSALTKIEQPKEILYIAEIPTLPNGKIDRNTRKISGLN